MTNSLENIAPEDIREIARKLTTGPNARRRCQEFLMSVGILTRYGNLSRNYYTPAEIKAYRDRK